MGIIKIDFESFIKRRMWFGYVWIPFPEPYDPMALAEDYTFRPVPSGWHCYDKPWVFKKID